MQLRNVLKSDLARLVEAITNVSGVVAVILFGSRAKGGYDEYSDCDLLFVFENDEVMLRNRRGLYENVGKLGLFTQVLTRRVGELQLRDKVHYFLVLGLVRRGILFFVGFNTQKWRDNKAKSFSPLLRTYLSKDLKPFVYMH